VGIRRGSGGKGKNLARSKRNGLHGDKWNGGVKVQRGLETLSLAKKKENHYGTIILGRDGGGGGGTFRTPQDVEGGGGEGVGDPGTSTTNALIPTLGGRNDRQGLREKDFPLKLRLRLC